MRKNKIIVSYFLILFSFVSMPSLKAASLWLSGNDLYSTQGAARNYSPGDIITIQISEESNAQTKATTNTEKGHDIEVSSGPQIPVVKDLVKNFSGRHEASTKFDGKGTTARSGKVTGTITATVVEVYPNGNLLLEGSRAINVNKETQIIRIRGVARPRDISSSNIINSKLLADAHIKVDGKGAVARPNRPGLITRLFNTVF